MTPEDLLSVVVIDIDIVFYIVLWLGGIAMVILGFLYLSLVISKRPELDISSPKLLRSQYRLVAIMWFNGAFLLIVAGLNFISNPSFIWSFVLQFLFLLSLVIAGFYCWYLVSSAKHEAKRKQYQIND